MIFAQPGSRAAVVLASATTQEGDDSRVAETFAAHLEQISASAARLTLSA